MKEMNKYIQNRALKYKTKKFVGQSLIQAPMPNLYQTNLKYSLKRYKKISLVFAFTQIINLIMMGIKETSFFFLLFYNKLRRYLFQKMKLVTTQFSLILFNFISEISYMSTFDSQLPLLPLLASCILALLNSFYSNEHIHVKIK